MFIKGSTLTIIFGFIVWAGGLYQWTPADDSDKFLLFGLNLEFTDSSTVGTFEIENLNQGLNRR